MGKSQGGQLVGGYWPSCHPAYQLLWPRAYQWAFFPSLGPVPPQSPRMAVPYWSTTATWLHASRTSSQPWLATWPPPIYIFFFYFQNSHLPLSPLTFPSLHLPIPLACRRLKSQKSWVLTRFLTLGLIFLYV